MMKDRQWDKYVIEVAEEMGWKYRAEYVKKFGSKNLPYQATEEQYKRRIEQNKPFGPLPEGCKS